MSETQDRERSQQTSATLTDNEASKTDNNTVTTVNDCNNETPTIEFPVKALSVILKALPPKQTYKCRAVNKQWMNTVDELLKKDYRWRKLCKKEFKDIYKLAHRQSPDLPWFNMYKSLILWSKVNEASLSYRLVKVLEDVGQCHNVEYFTIFNNTIGAHIDSYIDYFDLKTTRRLENRDYNEIFSKYRENERVVSVINFYTSRLLICPKTGEFDRDINFQEAFLEVERDVKDFVLTDLNIYYLKNNGDICMCKVTDDLKNAIRTFITQTEENVIALSYTNHLNLLTDKYDIYSLSNTNLELKHQYSYKNPQSLFDKLRKYNFLDIKWKDVYRFIASKHVEDSLVDIMWNISAMKQYGNILFIGTETGTLAVYKIPNNHFKLSALKPVREFDVTEIVHNLRANIPPDCRDAESPNHLERVIQHIDVVEQEDGHDIYVATVNNFIVLQLRHNLKRTASEAELKDKRNVKKKIKTDK